MLGWRHFLCEHPITAELIWSLVLPNTIKNGTRSLEEITKSGCLKFIVYYHQHSLGKWNSGIMDHAASYGHLDIVKFVHKTHSECCSEWTVDLAARYGHLDIVKFLHENRNEGCTKWAMDRAAANDHFNIVDFLNKVKV